MKIPSSNLKRLNQCLLLSQKVKTMNDEYKNLNNESKEKNQEILKLKKNICILKEVIEMSKQPYLKIYLFIFR